MGKRKVPSLTLWEVQPDNHDGTISNSPGLRFCQTEHKRAKTFNEEKDCCLVDMAASLHGDQKNKQRRCPENFVDYSDPFALPDVLNGLDAKYGSVTKEIEALCARQKQLIRHLSARYPAIHINSEGQSPVARTDGSHNVIDLDDDCIASNAICAVENPGHGGTTSVIVIDSDEEDNTDHIGTRHAANSELEALHCQLPLAYQTWINSDVENKINQGYYSLRNCIVNDNVAADLSRLSSLYQKVVLTNKMEGNPFGDLVGTDCVKGKDETECKRTPGETVTVKEQYVEGVMNLFAGLEDDFFAEESNRHGDKENDGLADIWRDMALASECSKETTFDTAVVTQKGGLECDHSCFLKDDLGYVCRICGVIQKPIDTIFDFQWTKGTKTTKTYAYGSRDTMGTDGNEIAPLLKHNDSEQNLAAAEIALHPRHMKQMKPHQLEGFNFLLRNLVTDNPGGCIMAHAPGSGKTFMIISFTQSFMAKYPYARPLIVLPKGILSTWKKEFQKWQVEDIPLYDFYSFKAENRSQQLDVLNYWMEEKSILFLSYKQFANIVCGRATSKAETGCQERLLKVPSLLILDEGHTPRNENTDVLSSLARVETPRKVVLSGTLFQNHVREVFNILNLVRPKFLKLDTSRSVVRRILSRVPMSGIKKRPSRTVVHSAFFDLVEEALQNDDNFKRKVTVIQDLREMTNQVLHYYKGDFLDELPGLVDFTILLNLSAKQKDCIQRLQNLEKFRRSSVGRAVYMHPYLKEVSENAAGEKGGAFNDEMADQIIDRIDIKDGVKTKFFLNILALSVSAGEKVLVFSQYLIPLKFLERLLVKLKGWSPGKEIFMISGDSSPEHREWSMEQFNNSPEAKVFFGSIKACGEGISLVGASRILILDVHLNPSVTRQAIGRAFRPGQLKTVYTYRLVAADSPEEDDHNTSFRKELISKMWFEWSEFCSHQDFGMEAVDVKRCEDMFLESPAVGEDVKVLYRR